MKMMITKGSVFTCFTHSMARSFQTRKRVSERIIARSGKKSENVPLPQRMLSGFLNLSSTPYSSYVPNPVTPLHRIDPRIKQIGTILLLFLLTSCGPVGQASLAFWLLILTLFNSPWRIARPTLMPLLGMSIFYFVLTALLADGSGAKPPPPNATSSSLQTMAPVKPPSVVLFKFWFFTVTSKSVRLAITTASIIFVALQSASLCLMTTPPEQLALALRQLLSPFRKIKLPVEEIGFCLLLSIRFLSTVFEELRNLVLGVAVRGIDWKSLGTMGSINLFLSIVAQLFRKLFLTCDKVAQALVIRGFVGPKDHQLYLMDDKPSSTVANGLAIFILASLSVVALRIG